MSVQTEKMFEALIRQWDLDFPGTDSTPIAIALRLHHLHVLDEEALQELLQPFGVGFGEIDVLTHLALQPAPHRLRPSDLAEFCMVTTGAITGRISRLEQRGYVSRVPSSADKRTIYVQMTASGGHLLRQTREQVARSSSFLNGIRALSPSERNRLNKTLIKLIQLIGR